jgi:uncharacterized membrane protein
MTAGRAAATIMLLLALVGGAMLPWVACARASSDGTISRAALMIYVAGHLVCHQRADRSFASCGVQWPVCGRCSGLYIGAAAGVLIFGLWGFDRVAMPTAVWRRRLLFAALPTAVVWAGEFVFGLDPGTPLRFVSALPAGAAGAAWLAAVARGDLQ